jgi:hypothetical protein
VVVLMVAGSSTAGVIGFVLLFSIGFGAGTIARPALLADAFGAARVRHPRWRPGGHHDRSHDRSYGHGPVRRRCLRTTTGAYIEVMAGLALVCVAAVAALFRAVRLHHGAGARAGDASAAAVGGSIMSM